MALLLTLPELFSPSGVIRCTRRRIVADGRRSRIPRVTRRSLRAYGKVADRETSIVRVSDPIKNAGFNPILSVPVLWVSSASPPPPSLRQQLQEMDGGDDKNDYYVNLGNAIRTLREDYPIIFYKEPGFSIYSPINPMGGLAQKKDEEINLPVGFLGDWPAKFKMNSL